ncbi:MAG: Nif3-like dinuclear metal center hexameric protein [Planctomycetes bacterium]|nr:Nif3-like dinuclear metal center hexameric protein [Planctomycetota bacterium]
MKPLVEILHVLQDIAPLETAEAWDNVGLLVGDPDRNVERLMTCLTVTSVTLGEAIENQVDLLISHHPIPFKPVGRITPESVTGRLLLQAIENRVSIYSPHTAWDNCRDGINAQLAKILRLESVQPVHGFRGGPVVDGLGAGRFGNFSIPISIDALRSRLMDKLPTALFRATHSNDHLVKRIGIVCGSGGSMLHAVKHAGCDAFLTGEATYHQCLEAEAMGIAVCMIGHHASEAFAMSMLADLVRQSLPSLSVFSSKKERSDF